jgi:hypothetical protein
MFIQIVGAALVVVGGALLFVAAVNRDGQENVIASKAERFDSQRRTIEAMDKTIRSQWELQRILSRRLGEKVAPPPVSITGLPDPKP